MGTGRKLLSRTVASVVLAAGLGLAGAGGMSPAAAGVIRPPQNIVFSLISPPGCNPLCHFGVEAPEGHWMEFKVRLHTSDGQPTRAPAGFRIYNSGPAFGSNPLCSRGSGLATRGVDYSVLDETRTAPIGTWHGTEYRFHIAAFDDGHRESNEQFYVYLYDRPHECVAIIDND